MKLRPYKRKFNEDIDIMTKEMKDYFDKRTKGHCNLVKYFGNIIINSFLDKKDLININLFKEDILNHDNSKFKEPEYTPYVYTTWDYKCKDEGIDFNINSDIKDKMNDATLHHVLENKHHPEYWLKDKYNNKELEIINRDDRDRPPKELLDCTYMPYTYIAIMCADWMAMSKERNNSPVEWADKNINIRWRFNSEQIKFIYDILNLY